MGWSFVAGVAQTIAQAGWPKPNVRSRFSPGRLASGRARACRRRKLSLSMSAAETPVAAESPSLSRFFRRLAMLRLLVVLLAVPCAIAAMAQTVPSQTGPSQTGPTQGLGQAPEGIVAEQQK